MDAAVLSQEQVEETEELLAKGLAEMRQWLREKTDDSKGGVKSSWKLPPCAPQWSDPALDAELLMFLRCELFNAKAAAKRYTKYWRRRASMFGDVRARHSLSSPEALVDSDVVALRKGYAVYAPGVSDVLGRCVLVVHPGRLDHKAYPRESMVRACWFVLHKILESEEFQRRGVRILVLADEGTYAEYDSKLERMLLDSLQATLPLRIGAVDVLNPPWFFSAIFAVLRLFMADKVYQRIKIHSETDPAKMMGLLGRRGLHPDMVPVELHGECSIAWDAWCERALGSGGCGEGGQTETEEEALLCAQVKALDVDSEVVAVARNGHGGVKEIAPAPAPGAEIRGD